MSAKNSKNGRQKLRLYCRRENKIIKTISIYKTTNGTHELIFQGVTSTPKTKAVTISIIFKIIKRKKLTREFYLIEFKENRKIVNLMTPEAFIKNFKESEKNIYGKEKTGN